MNRFPTLIYKNDFIESFRAILRRKIPRYVKDIDIRTVRDFNVSQYVTIHQVGHEIVSDLNKKLFKYS